MKRRRRIQILASVIVAMMMTFGVALFSFVFRGTEVLIWTEQDRSVGFRTTLNSSGYGWSMFAFGGFGWTEIEQDAITPFDTWEQNRPPNLSLPNAPYWSSAAEEPVPDDTARFCPTCRKKRVDGAFGWPLRVVAFRAESVWIANPNAPLDWVQEAYTLNPTIGWIDWGRISPIGRLVGFSGDQLVPGRILWPGLIANTAFFTVLLWIPVFVWRTYRWIVDGIRASVGACLNCGYDVAKQPEGTACPECGAEVQRKQLRTASACPSGA